MRWAPAQFTREGGHRRSTEALAPGRAALARVRGPRGLKRFRKSGRLRGARGPFPLFALPRGGVMNVTRCALPDLIVLKTARVRPRQVEIILT